MKIITFLGKLKKEKKLGLVEPSLNIEKSYLEKSESNLISSRVLLKVDRLEEATSLAYYSSYHALLVLLFKVGIKSENHTASIFLLKNLFDLDNSFISFAKKERIDKQYYVDFHVTKKDVEELIIGVEGFNENLVDFISKLTNEKIKFYRSKFVSLFEVK